MDPYVGARPARTLTGLSNRSDSGNSEETHCQLRPRPRFPRPADEQWSPAVPETPHTRLRRPEGSGRAASFTSLTELPQAHC